MPNPQRSLFDDPDPAALVRNEPVARALTRNQRRFNQLAERLQKLRTELATWQRAVDRYQQRAAENVEPLQRELLAEQRAAVLVLDQLLCSTAKGERLSARGAPGSPSSWSSWPAPSCSPALIVRSKPSSTVTAS